MTDFNGLIIKKLREFLSHIESHIRRAKADRWTEAEFYRRTADYLRAVNTFGKNLGDLMTYWDKKKSIFWSYVSIDAALVKKRMESLVVDKLGIYESICDEHKIEFTPDETAISDSYFITIRNARNAGTITPFANDADLMILADCLVYAEERLQQGILYLVTNDNGLHDTTLVIIRNPQIIDPTVATGSRVSGLEPLRPLRLITDYRNRPL